MPEKGLTPKGFVPWKPGQSGNPGGKAKTEREIAQLCRSFTSETAHLLMEIARNKKQAGVARVQAIKEIHDRAFGRSPERVRLETDVAGMANPQLLAFIRTMLMDLATKTIDAEPEPESEE